MQAKFQSYNGSDLHEIMFAFKIFFSGLIHVIKLLL
jgi:hypothetical protein